MPPKRVAPSHRQQSSFSYVYHALQQPENFSVVKSMAMFGAAVAFFASGAADFIVPVL